MYDNIIILSSRQWRKKRKNQQKVADLEEILVDVSNKTEGIVPHKNLKGNNLGIFQFRANFVKQRGNYTRDLFQGYRI